MSNDVTNFAASLVEMAKAMERVPELERQLANEIDLSTKELLRNSDLQVSLEASRRYAASLEQRCHDLEVSRDAAELRFLEADDVVSTIKSVLRRTMEDADSALKAIEPVVEPTPVEQSYEDAHPKPFEPVAETYTYEDAVRGMENVVEVPSPSPFPDTTPSTVQSPDEGMGKSEAGRPTHHDTSTSQTNLTQTTGYIASGEKPVEMEASTSEAPSPVPFASTTTPPNPAHPSPATTSDVGSSQTEAADAKPVGPYVGHKYMAVAGYIPRYDWLAGGGTNEDYDWRP